MDTSVPDGRLVISMHAKELLTNKIYKLGTVMPPIIALDVENTQGKKFHTRKFTQRPSLRAQATY